ncbi:hypothetical protein BR93DRAFT_968175 [Coniochaeta sp. PMI_546]|nr:hypothetical protein BR93DRAFT_968175 [Coniochaeta sp. PMI_546]
MSLNEGMMEFIQRYQALRAHRDSTDQLLTDLLLYSQHIETTVKLESEDLARQLHTAQLDLADATKSRRELQLELQQLKESVANLLENNQHLQVRPHIAAKMINERNIETVLQSHNPYVIVLIDGDGLLFKEHFVRRGFEGGQKAALALKAAILKQCHGLATEIEVIAKVCVNLAGLAQAMRKDNSLDAEGDLKDFSLGFTQGIASFDFVDIGSGRSATKIKETTAWHLKNYNCKHVILGVSHDASYAPFVNGLMQDDTTRQRITVLEGVPTVRELVATGVNVLNLNDALFRSEKLVDRSSARSTPVMLEPLPPPVNSPRAASGVAAPRPASTPAVAQPTYARAIKSASPPPQMTLPLPLQPKAASAPRQASQTAKPQPPPWNPGLRGLDPPIKVSQTALDNIKKRKDSNKLCNNHYLRGPCSKGDECCFEHKYRPSPEEIVAIAFLARLNPCTSGQDCEVENCIYGHHCPTVRDGHCTHPYCKFGAKDHPPGTVLRKNSKGYDDY